MRYSASNPLRWKFHFSALRHGDDGVVGRVVVCGWVSSSVQKKPSRRNTTTIIPTTSENFCRFASIWPRVLRYYFYYIGKSLLPLKIIKFSRSLFCHCSVRAKLFKKKTPNCPASRTNCMQDKNPCAIVITTSTMLRQLIFRYEDSVCDPQIL